MIRDRRHLARLGHNALRGPPLLDMLLALYVAELENRRLYQSGIESRGSRTSIHRHAATLVELGFATRRVDPYDQRRKQVILTRETRQAIDCVMDATQCCG